MNYLRISCTVVAVALAAQNLSGEPKDEKMVPASPTLTDEAVAVIKAAYPKAAIGNVKLNMDRGIQAWFVDLTGDPEVSSVEVSAGSAQITVPVMVMQSRLKLERKDLPQAVAMAADAAAGILDDVQKPNGQKFLNADKLQIFADFTPKKYSSEGGNYKLGALPAPVTVYDVTYLVIEDGEKGVVRLDPDGKVINPMNWMKHAAAVVPAGKSGIHDNYDLNDKDSLVRIDAASGIITSQSLKHVPAAYAERKIIIRANLGCVADYTDMSGTVWSADRDYKEGGGWGGLGREPHGGRQHSRVGLVIQGTDAPFIYDSERDKEGEYRFDVPNGLYTVRIHFCETWEGGVKPGSRPFAIDIQGKTVVPSMEIAQESGGWMKPLIKEFKDIQVTDGKLLITPHGNFHGNDKHASIEAYEVIQQ